MSSCRRERDMQRRAAADARAMLEEAQQALRAVAADRRKLTAENRRLSEKVLEAHQPLSLQPSVGG